MPRGQQGYRGIRQHWWAPRGVGALGGVRGHQGVERCKGCIGRLAGSVDAQGQQGYRASGGIGGLLGV